MTKDLTTLSSLPARAAATTRRPWDHVGCSRACWYRWLAAAEASPKAWPNFPRPLNLPNCGNLYRVEDLDRWLRQQATTRTCRRRRTAQADAPAPE